MTLFQLVNINSPLSLTQEGNKRLNDLIRKKPFINPSFLREFLKEGLEGLQIAASLSKEEGPQFFDELVDRDLG